MSPTAKVQVDSVKNTMTVHFNDDILEAKIKGKGQPRRNSLSFNINNRRDALKTFQRNSKCDTCLVSGQTTIIPLFGLIISGNVAINLNHAFTRRNPVERSNLVRNCKKTRGKFATVGLKEIFVRTIDNINA